jgi:hypothetical protein
MSPKSYGSPTSPRPGDPKPSAGSKVAKARKPLPAKSRQVTDAAAMKQRAKRFKAG